MNPIIETPLNILGSLEVFFLISVIFLNHGHLKILKSKIQSLHMPFFSFFFYGTMTEMLTKEINGYTNLVVDDSICQSKRE